MMNDEKALSALLEEFVIRVSSFLIFTNGSFYHFLPARSGHLNHGRRTGPQNGINRVGFDVCRGAVSPCDFWRRRTRLSTRHLIYDISGVATELHDWHRRLESDNGAACYDRHAGRNLVRRDYREI